MSSLAALRLALSGAMLRRALVVTVVVGTMLNAINQGDALLRGDPVVGWKLWLTYAVPFCVATFGSWSALRSSADRG